MARVINLETLHFPHLVPQVAGLVARKAGARRGMTLAEAKFAQAMVAQIATVPSAGIRRGFRASIMVPDGTPIAGWFSWDVRSNG